MTIHPAALTAARLHSRNIYGGYFGLMGRITVLFLFVQYTDRVLA